LQPEGLCQSKTPMTPSGIEPATFQLVARCLNQRWHHMPQFIHWATKKSQASLLSNEPKNEKLCWVMNFHFMCSLYYCIMLNHQASINKCKCSECLRPCYTNSQNIFLTMCMPTSLVYQLYGCQTCSRMLHKWFILVHNCPVIASGSLIPNMTIST
jgi:hypothetical protein